MNIIASQRCLVMWAMALITFILLIIYLDSSPDSQPILLAVLLFLTDATLIVKIFFDFFTTATGNNQQFSFNLGEIWYFLWPLHQHFLWKFVCMMMKALFEVLLFMRLLTPIHVPHFIIFIPFWIFFTIIFIDLTRRLNAIRKID